MSRVFQGFLLYFILPLTILYTLYYNPNMDKKYTLDKLDDGKLYSFKIEVSLLEWLRNEAASRKISVSQLIRDSIDFYRKFTKVNDA